MKKKNKESINWISSDAPPEAAREYFEELHNKYVESAARRKKEKNRKKLKRIVKLLASHAITFILGIVATLLSAYLIKKFGL